MGWVRDRKGWVSDHATKVSAAAAARAVQDSISMMHSVDPMVAEREKWQAEKSASA